ncbi:alpha/beta-hydrolase [Russula compacta]|nr:alpha/beta-hydrolase [Russula compacta]
MKRAFRASSSAPSCHASRPISFKMNPADPASFNHRTERLTTGRTYHFVDERPANYSDYQSATAVPTILCIHGFPDIWYGWRYQIGPWVRAGYRVVVPDMLGYGGTDKPLAAEEYSIKKLCGDLAALLNVIGVSKAIVIGHDWGSHIAGRFALWHPDRLLALGMLSVAFTPPNKQYLSLEDVVKKVPNYAYQLYFANPDSTKEIEANLERFLRIVFAMEVPQINTILDGNMREVILNPGVTRPPGLKPPLTNDELQYVVSQMRNMNGPLSYYRTTKIQFEDEQAAQLPGHLPATLPVLLIWGADDPTVASGPVSRMREVTPRFEEIKLPGRHWIMAQARDEVTEAVLRWLAKLDVGAVSKL